MGRANSSTRRKRLLRQQGVAQSAGKGDLVPHVARCACAACEERRKKTVRRGVTATEKRLRDYQDGHPHPEHKACWVATAHALAAYMALHDVNKFKNRKVTSLQLRPQFISYLDAEAGEHDLDPGRLYEALIVMRQVHPLRARIVESCVCERRTQDDVGTQEHMSHQAVGQNLEAGLDLLRDIYAGLVLAEQARVFAS